MTQHAPDPSQLIAEALGIPTEQPEPLHRPTRCCFSGATIYEGIRGVIGDNFMDQADLAGLSNVASPAAHALVRRKATPMRDPATGETVTANPLLTLQAFIVSRDGAWQLTGSPAVTRLLTVPPEPPFVAAMATGNSQHLPWRTPVTTSRELIVIRHGPEFVRVRRPLYQQAVAAYHRVRDAADAHEHRRRPRQAIFASQTRFASEWWTDISDGALLTPVRRAAAAAGLDDDIARLESLAPSERWALFHYTRTRDVPDQLNPLPLKGKK